MDQPNHSKWDENRLSTYRFWREPSWENITNKMLYFIFWKKIRLSQKRAIIIYIDGRESFPDFNCLVRTYLKIRFIYLYFSTSFLFVYLLPGFPKVACVADAKHLNPNIRRLLKNKLNARAEISASFFFVQPHSHSPRLRSFWSAPAFGNVQHRNHSRPQCY